MDDRNRFDQGEGVGHMMYRTLKCFSATEQLKRENEIDCERLPVYMMVNMMAKRKEKKYIYMM